MDGCANFAERSGDIRRHASVGSGSLPPCDASRCLLCIQMSHLSLTRASTSYDPLPYGLLAAEVSKKPAHVTNSHDPALWTHHLRRPQIQAHLLRDPQVLHYHSSLAFVFDAHYQRRIVADSRLSL